MKQFTICIRKNGVILKLDLEKAYAKIKWLFIQQVLIMKGFSNTFYSWIQQVVSKGSISIKVNDEYGHIFQIRKGVRQGDPLSPILFNIVVDMLAILINRAKNFGQFTGVIPIWLMGASPYYNTLMMQSSFWMTILRAPEI
jgi:hypothetical protein